MKEKIKNNWIKILFFIIALIFAIPSLNFMIKNGNVKKYYGNWTWLGQIPKSIGEKYFNAIIFIAFISILFLLYFLLIKKSNKLFKDFKQILVFILLVSILFVIVLPFTSLDIYEYIAGGWIEGHYHENPYYTSVNQINQEYNTNDIMLSRVANCWKGDTFVYGALWTFICTVLSTISMGNLTVAVFIFKIAGLIVHLLNCYLIWKICKNKKFVILYGLNPLVLFETLSNVHNEVFIIFFILLTIYFVKNKKCLPLAVMTLAMATSIKYWPILLLPFIILYGVKDKEKILDKLKFCFLYGIEFLAIILLLYLRYIKDSSVLFGLFAQQERYNRSITFLIYYLTNKNIAEIMVKVFLLLFTIMYIRIFIGMIKSVKNNSNLFKFTRKYNAFIVIFTFILITNFNPWYLMWLFPTMFWLNSKNIKAILDISYAAEIANVCSFALYSEDDVLGIPYLIIMIVITGILMVIQNYNKIKGMIMIHFKKDIKD